ncbi:hypothetical protein [Caldiplasma sukawensis]
MRVKILIPLQKEKYSVFYSIFDEISKILEYERIEYEKIYVNFFRSNKKKQNDSSKILQKDQLVNFIKNEDKETVFFTIDDDNLLRAIYGKTLNRKIIIWAHYFIGHRFIFKRYNEIDIAFKIGLKKKLIKSLAGLIPLTFFTIILRKYVQPMRNNFIISQSVWTGLLLERVYSIKTMGILPIPIDSDMWKPGISNNKNDVLVFLGNSDETDLQVLAKALKLVSELLVNPKIDYFGNEETGTLFKKEFGFKLNYLGKLSKEKLIENYQSHILTITPIFNGNFEMVPIESILCGTPTISFIQPFMEITGNSEMCANILNEMEIEIKINKWKNIDSNIMETERIKILERMDKNKISKELIRYIKESINENNFNCLREE